MAIEDDFPTRAVEVFNGVSKWADKKSLDLDTTPFNRVTEEFKADPQNLPAYVGDKDFWKMALQFIGGFIFICLIGSLILALLNLTIPDIIITSCSTAIGIFAGIFATNITKK